MRAFWIFVSCAVVAGCGGNACPAGYHVESDRCMCDTGYQNPVSGTCETPPRDAGPVDAFERPDAGCAAAETCNGIDDDCDGEIDGEEAQAASCVEGETCFEGACVPHHLWSTGFVVAASPSSILHGLNAIDSDASGNVFVGGVVTGPTDFGSGARGPGVFVASFEPDGDLRWLRVFEGTGELYLTDLVVTDDAVVATGAFGGSFDLAGTTYTGTGTVLSPHDAFVVSLDAGTGVDGWSRALVGTSATQGSRLSADAAGNIYLVVLTDGVIDAGGGPRGTAATRRYLIASYGLDGLHRWSRVVPATTSVARLAAPVVVGSEVVFALNVSTGAVDLGSGASLSGGPVALLHELLSGGYASATRYGGDDDTSVQQLMLLPSGSLMMAGVQTEPDFGTSAGGWVARVDGSTVTDSIAWEHVTVSSIEATPDGWLAGGNGTAAEIDGTPISGGFVVARTTSFASAWVRVLPVGDPHLHVTADALVIGGRSASNPFDMGGGLRNGTLALGAFGL